MAAGRSRRGLAVGLGAVVAIVVAVAAAVAFGHRSHPNRSLDLVRAQPMIVRAVSQQIGLAATDPRCPATVAAAPGTRFRCSLTAAGRPLRLDVSVRDASGSLQVRLVDALVRPTQVEADLRVRLRTAFKRSFTVACGSPAPRVLPPGSRFQCLAGDATSRRAVEVTVRDAGGALGYRVVS
ncbi:MAG: hypothetical protein JWN46_3769 [Acidimicrobiales bacterium]|nr:hypothetical protein [Acidimicrobiales bacterium]